MVFDTQTLTRIIERCLDLSMDGGLPADKRTEYLVHAKRLREQLLHLLGARFSADSDEFKQATEAMHETNHALAEAAEELEQVVKVVNRVAELSGHLDKALQVARRVLT